MNTIDASTAQPFLQLLLYVFSNRELVRRLHFRFQAGDESYNYVAESIFIGKFSEESAIEARAFVERHAAELLPFLVPMSSEDAGLRIEDASAFMKSLAPGQPLYVPPAAQIALPNVCYIATSTIDGVYRARVFPTNSIKLPMPVETFLAEYEAVAERLTGAAKLREKPLVPIARPAIPETSTEPKPWWKFW